MSRLPLSASLALTFLAITAYAGGAQQPAEWDANRVQVSRPALEDLLRRLDASVQSSAYSGAIRNHAKTEAAAVRARLAEGDFRVGDRIYLKVDGEQQLTDTFTVGPAKILPLPLVGDVPLAGVLHAELQSYLRVAIGKYVKDPVVRARSLIRLVVLGEVNRPGFFTVPTQTLVSDVVMLAGGPARDANMNAIRIVRGDERIWEGAAMQQAVAEGKTLDQLSLEGGDHIEVPRQGGFFISGAFRFLSILVALPGAIYGITRLF